MGVKRVISSLLLAVYIMASCGAMLSVILCHCTRSTHFQTHHSCHCCSHCHSNGEGIKLPSNCDCTHDHSTEIDLYDYEKIFIADLAPNVCAIFRSMQTEVAFSLEGEKLKYLDKRKIPLPESEFVALTGLRAPPVIA